MEGLLHRAIAQHTPTRAVWITREFVAEARASGPMHGGRRVSDQIDLGAPEEGSTWGPLRIGSSLPVPVSGGSGGEGMPFPPRASYVALEFGF